MKKFLIPIIAFAAMVTSCSKDGSTALKSTDSAVISAYVANNYPATAVSSVSASVTGTTVTLSTGEQIAFSPDDSVRFYSNNKGAGLCVDSLDRHRPGFGGPGMIIEHHGGKQGLKCDRRMHGPNALAVDSLPILVNDYIAANYPGYTVIHAQKDTLCAGAVIEAMVCVKAQEPVKLVFNATSFAYLMKAERALYANVPTAVSAAVTASYSTYTVMKRVEKFTLADASVQYKVFMRLDNVRKAVTFNADGTVVCEK